MKKIMNILLLGTVLSLISAQSIFASSVETSEKIIVPEKYAKQQSETIFDYGESEVITVLNTEYKSTTVTPDGQLPGGTRFGSGGGFYVNTEGGFTVSISFSLSWGIYNAGVSVGHTSTNAIVGGLFLLAPTTTDYYKVKITKTLKFERHLVDVYQYGQYKYSYYTTVSSVYSQNAYLEKV